MNYDAQDVDHGPARPRESHHDDERWLDELNAEAGIPPTDEEMEEWFEAYSREAA